MGGFSSIEYITTDANNMGGLFVRKLGGAAALSVHMHKLLPLLFHPSDAKWNHGHFRPLLITALFCNLATLAFYGDYLEDLVLAEADALPKLVMFLLAVETMVIGYYLMTQKKLSTGPAVAMPKGKTPSSVPSRIVMRTVGIISPVIVLVAGRDLFFPGHILSFFPRDDIYLEWTGAFFHSPPEGSPEATEQGLEAPLYVGEKFIAQLMALHLLLLCVYKFVSSFLVKIRSDGSGFISSRMMWRGAAIGGGLVVLMFRLFKHAATSASWDTSWHLMTLAYEAFILGTCMVVVELRSLHSCSHVLCSFQVCRASIELDGEL